MRLIDRFSGERGARMTFDEYVSQVNAFAFNGSGYGGAGLGPGVQETLAGQTTEAAPNNFVGLATHAYAANGVVFACMLVRQLAFSSVRFRFQRLRNGKPSDTFGTADLQLLERPWVGGTTQDLLSRQIQDADLAGNSYWYRDTPLARLGSNEPNSELVRMRPDWVDIICQPRMIRGGPDESDYGGGKLGYRKVGYLYTEGGARGDADPVAFLADEVVHFCPLPDPLASFRGMSWLTPIIREIQADQAMTQHQRKFFDRGATVNMIIKHPLGAERDAIKKWSDAMESTHGGVENAYKNLNLYPGADATPVGSHLKDIDFKNVRGGGETRVAAAAGVPPVIVGLSEGLAAATYSNYGQARRRFADGTMHPLWQNASGSMERVVPPPGPDARLWYDASDVPFLREDEKDAAEIQKTRAETINTLILAGYKPDSVVLAIESGDLTLLVHSGLTSVQLIPPGKAGATDGESVSR